MSHQNTPQHKANRRNQTRQLKIRQPHNRMPRSTAARIPRPKPHQKATNNYKDKSPQRPQTRKTKQVRRHQPIKLSHVLTLQFRLSLRRDFKRCRILQKMNRNKCTQYNSSNKKQIPYLFPPIVLKKGNIARYTHRANMFQSRRYPKLLTPQNQ